MVVTPFGRFLCPLKELFCASLSMDMPCFLFMVLDAKFVLNRGAIGYLVLFFFTSMCFVLFMFIF